MNNIGGNHGLENTTHAVRLILKYALEVGGVYFGISFIWFYFITLLHFHLFVVRQRYLYKLWLKILNIVEIYRFC